MHIDKFLDKHSQFVAYRDNNTFSVKDKDKT